MVVVVKKKGETVDKLFKRFSKLVRDENISFEASKKNFFKTKKELRKEKLKDKAKRKALAKKGLDLQL